MTQQWRFYKVITCRNHVTCLIDVYVIQAPTGRRCKVNAWRNSAVSNTDQGLQNNSHNASAVQNYLQNNTDISPGPDYYQPFRDEWQPREVCGDIQPSSMFAKTSAATLKHVS
jgi:hypothetical protein